MSRKVLSARGAEVDFDRLKIKKSMSEAPKTIDVVNRERFIDKRRRRTSRKIDEMLAQQEESKRHAQEAIKNQKAETPAVEKPAEDAPKTEGNTNEKFKRKINR